MLQMIEMDEVQLPHPHLLQQLHLHLLVQQIKVKVHQLRENVEIHVIESN
jgi:hypothetical protein